MATALAGVRRTISGFGRTLVTLGLLILLFVVYQLWGTGIWTARAQDNLDKQFEQAQADFLDDNPVIAPTTVVPPPTNVPTSTTTLPVRPTPPIPPIGEVAGEIRIPKIGLDMKFVEGTDRDELKKGPGHYPGTPMPGTLGNAAIAGHRTTYAAPFGDVDKLRAGDEIIVETVAGTFTYRVYACHQNSPTTCNTPFGDQSGHLIVGKHDTWVVNQPTDPQAAELTLTSCHPKGSAEQRIVVKARLVPEKSPKPAKSTVIPKTDTEEHADGLAAGLSGQTRSLAPSIAWGVITLAVGVAWWWCFRRWRHPLTWVLGLIPFMMVLFPFYVFLERALPAGY